jgi:hypothetical protein
MRQRKNGFISYAHFDDPKKNKYIAELQKHLHPKIRNGELNVWCDTDIKAGDEWRTKINRNIETASFSILLVSPSFLASSFIVDYELPPLLEAAEKEGLLILSLLISPCLIPDELKRYQFFNNLK